MRKHTLLSALFFVAFITIRAQDFTIRLNGGYSGAGFQNTESVLGPAINPTTPMVDALAPMANQNDSLKTYKAVHGSYGSGGNVNLGVGYMINKFFGVDLGVSYAHSNDISCTEVKALISGSSTYIQANIHSFSYAIAVAPSLIITAQKTNWKVYPYARIGITLPVAGKLTDNVDIFAPVPAGTSTTPGVLNNNGSGWLGRNTSVQLVTQATVSIGMGGAIGVAYRPIPLINVFVEATGMYLNVRGKSSTITKWTADGMNDIPLRGVYRTQINYVDELNAQSNNAQYNNNYNPNQPKQDTRPIVPGSNLGFNAGITFFLSKKTLKKDTNNDTNKK